MRVVQDKKLLTRAARSGTVAYKGGSEASVNHKRKRPKHQRAGCLYCKPHKDERRREKDAPRDRRRTQIPIWLND